MKSLLVLRYAKEYCQQAQYIIKIDDDMFLNIPLLLESLDEHYQKHEKFFLCHVVKQNPIFRSTLYNIHVDLKEIPGRVYPDHCFGGSYAFTGASVEPLF